MSDDRNDLTDDTGKDAPATTRSDPPERDGPPRDPRLEERRVNNDFGAGEVVGRGTRTRFRTRWHHTDLGTAAIALVVIAAPALAGVNAIARLLGPLPLPAWLLLLCSSVAVLAIASLRTWARAGDRR